MAAAPGAPMPAAEVAPKGAGGQEPAAWAAGEWEDEMKSKKNLAMNWGQNS